MSSIVVIQHTDAIHLITDGAQYDPDGVVLSFHSKVTTLAGSGCVMALRGASWPKDPLALMLHFSPTLDDIAAALPDIMQGIIDTHREVAGEDAPAVDRHFEVTIAGWSDSMQRMVALVASSYQSSDPDDGTGHSHMPGYQQGVPWLPGQGYTAPPVDIQSVLGRSFQDQADIDAIDPIADGFALHCAQRREGGIYCGKAAYLVGGFAELTTVRRDSVQRRVIHRWPDEVGKPITPADAAPLEIVQAALDATRAYEGAKAAALANAETPMPLTMAA